LEEQLVKEGFTIQQFTSNLVYPETFKNAINAKNNSVQLALKAENDVKTAEAEAKIKVAQAEGDAKSMLTRAKAEAESYKLKQTTLTDLLIQQQWIEAWKHGGSQVPTYIGGEGGQRFMLNLK
jgi:regulator of protease activity HflC (stomatin/prohibitin superfamily)